MLARFTGVVEGLQVYPENMGRNLDLMHGLVFSQQVMLALVERGADRESAYKLTQKLAMAGWEGEDFRRAVRESPEVRERLSAAEIERCFDLDYHFQHLQQMFEQLGI